MTNLQINGDRLWQSMMDSARIGATSGGGLSRLALTDLDREMRDLFVGWCEDAGCSVTIDLLGNISARRSGRDEVSAPIAFGSHLDTQPLGGRFDGVLGVLAGLEVMRTLQEAGYVTGMPLELINWTNEEGSRFAPAMLSSGGFAGVFDIEYVLSRRDRDGKTFGDELRRIGYAGSQPIGRPLSAYFELHIEQGPILESKGKLIGVVNGGQGAKWYEITVKGNSGHSGATPMRLRRDALVGASQMIAHVDEMVRQHEPEGVATVGLVEVKPNSRNVVPGEVFFTVDLRHPRADALARMDRELRRKLGKVAASHDLDLEISLIWDSEPARFNSCCISFVREAAKAGGYSSFDVISGAAHDAIYVSKVAPTAMIFVPCKGGVSHNEAESIEFDHAVAGANVLLHAILNCDRHLSGAGKLT